MANLKPGAAGTFNGKIGSVVISKWRNKKVGRGTPRKSSKEPSPKQLAQRCKMVVVTRFLAKFEEALTVGFPKKAGNSYGWEKAVQYHLKNALSGTFPDYQVDIDKLLLSQGGLAQVDAPEMWTEENRIFVDWVNPKHLMPGNNGNDKVYLCTYASYGNPEHSKAFVFEDHAERKDGLISCKIDTTKLKGPVHVWIFLSAQDKKQVADSAYLGTADLIK